MKYNLTELMADAEKDNTAAKPAYKILSQDNIAELLEKNRVPPKTADHNEK